jgi:hypothetical protein
MTSLTSLGLIRGLFNIGGVGGFFGGFLKAFGVGLAGGGWITEPIAGIGMRSGRGYTLAENGPEYVSNMAQMSQRRQAPQQIVVRFEGGNLTARGQDLHYALAKAAKVVRAGRA